MEWQPIETAPRDGTPILLFYPEGIWDSSLDAEPGSTFPDWAVMRWDVEWGKRAPEADYCWRGYYEATTPKGKPTHWLPIPAAPRSTP